MHTSRLLHSTYKRFRLTMPFIGVILLISAVLLGSVLFLHLWKGIPLAKLTRDPLAVGQMPVYIGFLSQIGVFFWAAAIAICLFSSALLAQLAVRRHLKRFLFISALLTSLLALDEVFMLHETVLPYFGIPEIVVLGSYALFFLLYFLKFYRLILRTEYLLLLTALSFFALSILLDQWQVANANLHYLLEDGTKLVGIVSWLGYFFHVGLHALHRAIGQRSPTFSSREPERGSS